MACQPNSTFSVIPVEEKQIWCCQNLLEILPKMSQTRLIFSSPSLPSLVCFDERDHQPLRFSEPNALELVLAPPVLLSPHLHVMGVPVDPPSSASMEKPSAVPPDACCLLDDSLTHLLVSGPAPSQPIFHTDAGVNFEKTWIYFHHPFLPILHLVSPPRPLRDPHCPGSW